MKNREEESLREALSSSYWHEAQARLVLEVWRESGVSLNAFSKRHGLCRSRVLRWKNRLEQETAPSFHPVRIVVDQESERLGHMNNRVELVLRNGRRVAVGAGFDASVLERLVDVVESWSC